MPTPSILRRWPFAAIFRSAHVPAAIALGVVLVIGVLAGHLNRQVHQQAARAEVQSKINLIRARLEGNINGNIQLVRGLVATIATEPDISQARFAALARNLFSGQTQLRNIAGAPDLVISLMYPMAGNEAAIGLDYAREPTQREAALRARDTRDMVLAGPVDLKQGGQGFIGRFPVFVTGQDGRERFWGIVSAVVDVGRLYRDSGLLAENLGLDIALVGKDGSGQAGARFFGPASVLHARPVTADVILPSGSWRIAAVPTGGWPFLAPNAWLVWTLIGLAAILTVGPLTVAGRMADERRKTYGKLARSEREMRRLSRRLEIALDASRIGVWELDLATDELLWDDRLYELYGVEPGRSLSTADWSNTIHPDDLPAALREYEQAAHTQAPYSSEYRLLLPDGSIRHMRTKAAFFRDMDGKSKLVGAEWDVTADVTLREDLERARFLAELRNAELEAAKQRIEHNALHDSLTGLPNRRYLDRMLDEAGHVDAALLHIDLDRFKQINDTLGHAAGDAMLVHAAKVLAASVRDGDFVARIGGDEFVVFATEDTDSGSLTRLASRIIDAMREPVPYQGHLCRFGVSIGIAMERGVDADARRLMVNADIALYRAKSRGRNRCEFFTAELQSDIVRTKRLADEILGGLERGEFIAHYQPQFDARTHRVTGVEALVRWQHPTRGLLGPHAFLATADELNVVSTIDRMVLEKAHRDFLAWRAAGIDVPRVSVNVSARRLKDGELIRSLKSLSIEPGTVAFELVESIFLDEQDDLIEWNVNQLKELGIEIEIDDFGTGYASIVSLQKLKPHRLKIDRQLVTPIARSSKQRKLLESIIEIGKSLDIGVLAEGVETMQHARILRDIGCDALQGYAFARPMPAEEVRTFLASHRLRKAS